MCLFGKNNNQLHADIKPPRESQKEREKTSHRKCTVGRMHRFVLSARTERKNVAYKTEIAGSQRMGVSDIEKGWENGTKVNSRRSSKLHDQMQFVICHKFFKLRMQAFHVVCLCLRAAWCASANTTSTLKLKLECICNAHRDSEKRTIYYVCICTAFALLGTGEWSYTMRVVQVLILWVLFSVLFSFHFDDTINPQNNETYSFLVSRYTNPVFFSCHWPTFSRLNFGFTCARA